MAFEMDASLNQPCIPKLCTDIHQCSSNVDEPISNGKYATRFKATIMWNSVVKAFRNRMTLKRHRRLLFFYENSFTGKEAVDFFMAELPNFCTEKKEFTRSNCQMLLEKFADAGLFVSVRGTRGDDKDTFKENEIYRFSDIPLEKIATTPVIARRAASFNERSSSSYGRKLLDATRHQQSCPAPPNTPGHDSSPVDTVLPQTPLSNLPNSRRISLSYGSLPAIINNQTADLNEWSDTRPLDENQKNLEAKPDDTSGNKENINSCRKKRSVVLPVDIPALSARLITDLPLYPSELNKRKYSQPQSVRNESKHCKKTSTETIDHLPVAKCRQSIANNSTTVTLTWKTVICNRLKKLLHVDLLDDIIMHSFTGSDVRWNCEQIGISEIVKVKSCDALSPYFLSRMRYLIRWPFDLRILENTRAYDGIELDIFKEICEYFDSMAPLFPTLLANTVFRIVSLIKARSLRKSTVFSSAPKVTKSSVKNEETSQTSAAFQRHKSVTDVNDEPSISSLSTSSLVTFDRCELISSTNLHLLSDYRCCRCCLITRVGHAEKPDFVVPLFLANDIPKEYEKILVESIATVLLTLTPANRHRLHSLLRFMKRISENKHLQLCPACNNRCVVLNRLTKTILHTETATECFDLVQYLVNNQHILFRIPKLLKVEAKQLLSICNSKPQISNCSKSLLMQNSVTRTSQNSATVLQHRKAKNIDLTLSTINNLRTVEPKLGERTAADLFSVLGTKKSKIPRLLGRFRNFTIKS